ncbi:MAG: acetyl-CoA carboxylase biotin carboxyl carrier protein subunit [Bacteriovoracaceae bacterium]
MRYYLVDKNDSKEYVFNLIESIRHSAELMEFTYNVINEGEVIGEKKVYICKRAARYFASFDGQTWKKIPRQEIPDTIVNTNKEFHLHRGFKPSGIDNNLDSGLRSQMPGKVTDVFVKVGQKIEKGDNLLVLEAMKMENVIKASQAGAVERINVKAGETVEKGVLLLSLES